MEWLAPRRLSAGWHRGMKRIPRCWPPFVRSLIFLQSAWKGYLLNCIHPLSLVMIYPVLKIWVNAISFDERAPHIVWLSPWASCQIRKIAVAHAPGMPGTFSPSPHVSDPDMHHGTCVTHVPWCMPGSLYSSFLWNWRRGKTFPAFPAHAQPVFLRIWQEAH